MKLGLIALIFFSVNAWATGNLQKQPKVKIVQFQSGSLTLRGEMFVPKGAGPFPAVLFNHGSGPSEIKKKSSRAIASLFNAKGWILFIPYRRGHGLSAGAGNSIHEEIEAARKAGGEKAAAEKYIELLTGDHFADQMAALQWLQTRKYVNAKQIAVAGNSFGGTQVVLGAETANYCAAIDAAGGAKSWSHSPELQTVMKFAVRNAMAPIFFFQATNDFDLTPTRVLSAEMQAVGKPYEAKIYPPWGKSTKDGHAFGYEGSAVWFGDVFKFIEENCQSVW